MITKHMEYQIKKYLNNVESRKLKRTISKNRYFKPIEFDGLDGFEASMISRCNLHLSEHFGYMCVILNGIVMLTKPSDNVVELMTDEQNSLAIDDFAVLIDGDVYENSLVILKLQSLFKNKNQAIKLCRELDIEKYDIKELLEDGDNRELSHLAYKQLKNKIFHDRKYIGNDEIYDGILDGLAQEDILELRAKSE